MERKYFMWYQSWDGEPCVGAYYKFEDENVRQRYYHTLEELSTIGLSDSLLKKINGAKIGTKIKISKYSTRGDLMLIRIEEENIKTLDKLVTINNKASEYQEKIDKLEEDSQDIIDKLKVNIERYY